MMSDYEDEFFGNDKTYHGMANATNAMTMRQDSSCSQNSLRVCAELQQQDPAMLDFMESNINIAEYLGELDPYEEGRDGEMDEDDPKKNLSQEQFLNQQKVLYEQYQHMNYDFQPQQSASFYHAESSSALNHISPPLSLQASPIQQNNLLMVKKELDDDESSLSPSPSFSGYSGRKPKQIDPAEALKVFTPTTKARRYNPKPDEEKTKPQYKLKRARNNDAVRRSRTKAKEAQMARDDENMKLKAENAALKKKLDSAMAQLNALKAGQARFGAR